MARAASTTHQIVAALQERVRDWERSRRGPTEMVSSGCPALDRLLPDGGFCRGTLVEWLADRPCGGAGSLALAIAGRACREAGALVVVERAGDVSPRIPNRARMFYPPAAAAWGIDWEAFVIVRPPDEAQEAWAVDQALRSAGVGAVLCWPRRLSGRQFRRLQLAAESAGTLGLLVRPEAVRGEPSWAEARLLVEARCEEKGRGDAATRRRGERKTDARWLRVEVLHSRGGRAGKAVELEFDEWTGEFYESRASDLVSRLADPTAHRRSAGA